MSQVIHSTSCVFQSPYSYPRRSELNLSREVASLQKTAELTEDLVIMFPLFLPLAVFSFSVKLSSFTLVANVRIILYFSHLYIHFFKKR